jgi:hypothetical protein
MPSTQKDSSIKPSGRPDRIAPLPTAPKTDLPLYPKPSAPKTDLPLYPKPSATAAKEPPTPFELKRRILSQNTEKAEPDPLPTRLDQTGPIGPLSSDRILRSQELTGPVALQLPQRADLPSPKVPPYLPPVIPTLVPQPLTPLPREGGFLPPVSRAGNGPLPSAGSRSAPSVPSSHPTGPSSGQQAPLQALASAIVQALDSVTGGQQTAQGSVGTDQNGPEQYLPGSMDVDPADLPDSIGASPSRIFF